MENFTKIKKKIFTRNLRPNSFGIYESLFVLWLLKRSSLGLVRNGRRRSCKLRRSSL